MAMTSTGLETQRYAEILNNVKQRLFANLSPKIDLSEDSAIGILLSTVCLEIAGVHEIVSEVYDSGIITKAEGTSLDELTLMNGIYRLLAQSTTGFVEVTGDVGRLIPATARLRSTAGDIFNPREDYTITPVQSIGAQLYVNSVRPGEEYVIIIDNVIFRYTATNMDDEYTILVALQDLINGGLEMKASIDLETDPNRPTLVIERDPGSLAKRTQVAVVTGTTYLTFTKATILILADAETPGAIVADAGVINDMETVIAGVDSVYNRWDMTTGRDEETDTELRQRYLDNLVVTGVATLDSILQAVRRVPGVQTAFIEENDTEQTSDTGIPAKSFKVTVVGGDVNSIAQAIWDTKPVGIRSFGSTQGVAVDTANQQHVINFFRPTEKFAWVKLEYTIDNEETLNYNPSDLESEIKRAINNYGATLEVGEDIIPNRIIRYVYEHVQGIIIYSVTAAISGNQSQPPADSDYTSTRIPISNTEYTVWETNQYSIKKNS